MTQTQPEPSMYVRIKVDANDIVVGYLLVIAFVDDVRYFGTEPEVEEYKKAVLSRLKVKFEKPPVQDFVSIETYQNLEEGTFELKMPKYFEKAKTFFKDYVKGDFKERKIPLTVLDEKCLFEHATDAEIEEAKGLPFLQAVGILSYPASNCKFEMRYAISVLGSRRAGWSKKHFAIAVKLFEYALTTKDIGLIFSKGLDPHGENILYAYGDASLRIPRPQGCRIVMMNGAALSFVSKMQTLTAPSTTWAETVTLFDCSTDVLGLRNLLEELGHFQETPTVIFQDNKSAIQIANNRGSLGKSSRAMDLKTLAIRNRIEDHNVETEFLTTKGMLADMGSKALPEFPFTQFRDTMNGYALVRARFPDKVMSPYIYEVEDKMIVDLCKATDKWEAAMAMQPEALPRKDDTDQRGHQLKSTQAMIMTFTYHDDMSCDTEEEEDEVDLDDVMDDNAVENVQDDGEILPLPEPNGLHAHIAIDPAPPLEDDFELQFNDNPFEFNHKWTIKRAFPDYKEPVFELDDLPDPRLYGIDVAQLHSFARNNTFDPSYQNYLLRVENDYLTTTMFDNLLINMDLLVDANIDKMQRRFNKSNPIMFFPPVLSANEEQRKKQIHRALYTYVVRLDIQIKSKTMYDSLDNIHWGIGTGDPSPKLPWLRWLRWRTYFIHMKLAGINAMRPELGPLPHGPPLLREIDKVRMSLSNCFALVRTIAQFACNSYGCLTSEDPLPPFPNVDDKDIILYQYKSIWTLDLNDFNGEMVWTGSKLFNGYHPPLQAKMTLRQKSLQTFMMNQYPEWGRTSSYESSMDASNWTTYNVNGADEDFKNGWEMEGPAKKPKHDNDK